MLDVDYHHGNGTQQIFYGRGDVLYASLHADPNRAYPYYAGYAEETGAGAGEGTTLNLPLPPQLDDDGFLAALERASDGLGPLGELEDPDRAATHELPDGVVTEMVRRGDDLHAPRR